MTEASKNPNGMPRLVLTLFAITAVTSLLLGIVNYITEDIIRKRQEEKEAAAMEVVLPRPTDEEIGYSFTKLEYTGSDAIVEKVYRAEDVLSSLNALYYVVLVSPSGFGGEINMAVGIDQDNKVTGVTIISMSETSGLGSNASSPDFLSQFVGGTGKFAVSKDGGEIDALTGATVTSRAVTRGVNSALEAVSTLNKEG
jgi:electron transport complex protein RnfG